MSHAVRDHGTKAPPPAARRSRVRIQGDTPLLRSLRKPLRRALERRRIPYEVSVRELGACGEVLVSISTARGPMPLRFAGDDLEPGFVANVVRTSLDRFGL
jgi:hypothetical protein